MPKNETMDFEAKSSDLPNELNDGSYVGIAAILAVKVEPASSYVGNSTCHLIGLSTESSLNSEAAVEPTPHQYNCNDEKDDFDTVDAMKPNLTENVTNFKTEPFFNLYDEFSDVSGVDTATVKVESTSSNVGNSTCHLVGLNTEIPLKSEVAFELASHHYNCNEEKDYIANATKSNSTENFTYSIPSELHDEINGVSGVDIASTVAVKVKSESSYVDNTMCQVASLSCEASTNTEQSALQYDFNGQTVFIKQEVSENQIIPTEIKEEITDNHFFENTSVLDEYKCDLKTQHDQNPSLEAGEGTFEKREESNLDYKQFHPVNETRNLSCDFNSFVDSLDQDVCNKVKTIHIRNCSVLLKRLDITRLKISCADAPRESFHIGSNSNLHENSHHCSDFDNKCSNEQNLRKRKKLQGTKKYFQCLHCEKTFSRKSALKLHEVYHLSERPFGCTQCDKKFKRNKNLKQHKLIHLSERPLGCSQCDKKFISKYALEQHKLIHSDDKPFACSQCDKKFTIKISLKQHELIHSGEKPFECSRCNKKFMNKVYLKHHELIHSDDKPFECSQCDKKFKRKRNLKQHEQTHAKEKTHWCSQCDKEFTCKENLRRHKLTHSRPFGCSHCHKQYTRADYLKRHELIHSVENSFGGTQCDKFMFQGALEKAPSKSFKQEAFWVHSMQQEI